MTALMKTAGTDIIDFADLETMAKRRGLTIKASCYQDYLNFTNILETGH